MAGSGACTIVPSALPTMTRLRRLHSFHELTIFGTASPHSCLGVFALFGAVVGDILPINR